MSLSAIFQMPWLFAVTVRNGSWGAGRCRNRHLRHWRFHQQLLPKGSSWILCTSGRCSLKGARKPPRSSPRATQPSCGRANGTLQRKSANELHLLKGTRGTTQPLGKVGKVLKPLGKAHSSMCSHTRDASVTAYYCCACLANHT